MNLNEIASTLQLSRDTAGRYLQYLQQTFIVRTVPPFFRNVRFELTKRPKVFFVDLGLRNLLAGRLRADSILEGAVAEGFVFTILSSLLDDHPIRYWRTEGKAEVDFVVETVEGLLPIEVKTGALTRPRVPSGLRSFVKACHPPVALVLNATLDASTHVNDTEVRFVPRDQWLPTLAERLADRRLSGPDI